MQYSILLVLLPVILGMCAVIQGTFNRQILNSWDIVSMAFFNAWTSLVISGIFLILQYIIRPNQESFWTIQFNILDFKWWFIIAPATIVFITIGMAFSISKLNASTVFVLFMIGQLGTSLIWDGWIQGNGYPFMRLAGVALALVGGVMVSRS